jgi:hypothetical protein
MEQSGGGCTPSPTPEHIGGAEGTRGTETSHVPGGRERMRGVVASETRVAQTVSAEWSADLCGCGVVRSPWRPGRSRDRVDKPAF